MKIKYLIVLFIAILAFSVSSCIEPNYVFSKKDWYAYDLYGYSDFCEIIRADGKIYYSKQDTFRYLITIYNIEPNVTVVLNSFKFTDKDNNPISAEYYVKTATDTVDAKVRYERHILRKKIEIDTLPMTLRDSLDKTYSIEICAKTDVQIKDLQVVRVGYDFQVGDQQYIRDNIIYKRRFKIAIEGHEWNPSFLR